MGTGTPDPGWMITGFQTVVVLWGWVLLVLLHAMWRALAGPQTDPIRPTGPIH
jgi:hypothetical protein